MCSLVIELLFLHSYYSTCKRTTSYHTLQLHVVCITTKALKNEEGSRLNYTFFRGTKEQLTGGKMPEPSDMTVTVTVVQDGKPDIILNCPGGTNLRQLLVGNGINVYRSLTRWTNCNGKQRCGTCIVDVSQGYTLSCSIL